MDYYVTVWEELVENAHIQTWNKLYVCTLLKCRVQTIVYSMATTEFGLWINAITMHIEKVRITEKPLFFV